MKKYLLCMLALLLLVGCGGISSGDIKDNPVYFKEVVVNENLAKTYERVLDLHAEEGYEYAECELGSRSAECAISSQYRCLYYVEMAALESNKTLVKFYGTDSYDNWQQVLINNMVMMLEME